MSDDLQKPVDETTPSPAEVTPETPEATMPLEAAPAPLTPESFVQQELAEARASLRNTQLYGSIVTGMFMDNMRPTHAAEIIKGIAIEQIESNRDLVVSEVSTRVPAMIQQAPDMARDCMASVTADESSAATLRRASDSATAGCMNASLASASSRVNT